MSSFLCFICRNTVNSDTNEDSREKYREIVGMNLCPDSHLCYICDHLVNKLWSFKSLCLKRSLEYPVLFSAKGTVNLQRSIIKPIILCTEEICSRTGGHNLYIDNKDQSINSQDYIKLEDDRDDYDANDFFHENTVKEAEKCTNDRLETIGDELFNNDGETFNNGGEMFNYGGETYNNDGETFNNDSELDNINTEQIQEDNVTNNYENNDLNANNVGMSSEFYAEEKNECLNEIRNECAVQEVEEEADSKTDKNSPKTKSKAFEKILLSFEEQKAELEQQRRNKKYLEAEFKCYNCALGFLFKDTYQTHMMRHEEEEKDSSGLHQHLKRFHMTRPGNRTYSCSVCGKNYNNQAAVRTHMIKHIHRKFSCDQCTSIFSSPYTLSQHKKKHVQTEESKEFFCETCGLSYSTRKSLLAHQRQSLNHQSRSFECPICNRTCPNEKSLASHISAVHSTSKDFSCSTCSARYTNRKSLVRHIRSHTNPTPIKLAYCHICGNSFKVSTCR
ncbi:zinc finger and SCAN domain-containing protein 2-like [Spodoptera litura]|uniref:Zinc finger and SCAN domain-containing protein 2-like n=1 Tax=Spodoptera litura TaxID=69820 RepID=A0A9J7IYZ1_SPOLT|nr:zinc finger and SCAN domain-containing protein 2-like [Spodoptera litura]